jgi:NAD(P)-dependent dehydrogenase (short-subunit alcohol dehydrogenase family)
VASQANHQIRRNVTFFHGSVLNWEDQLNIFELTVKTHGRVDIVIANAGIDEVAEDVFVDTFDDDGKLKAPSLAVLDVNIRGVIFTTKLALSFFRRLNIKGSLVATGSAASYLDTPGIPVYNASKHGVIGLIRSLRDTLAQEGLIRTNVVAPWFTLTPFTQKLAPTWAEKGLPANTPDDIAKAIVYLSVHTDYHGKSLYVAGGRYTELEEQIQSSRDIWLGEQNTAWVDQRKSAKIKLGKQDN